MTWGVLPWVETRSQVSGSSLRGCPVRAGFRAAPGTPERSLGDGRGDFAHSHHPSPDRRNHPAARPQSHHRIGQGRVGDVDGPRHTATPHRFNPPSGKGG